MHGFGGWLISAYLVGFGTGASNTVASLFVVEFTPESEWSQRISWVAHYHGIDLSQAALDLASSMVTFSARGLIPLVFAPRVKDSFRSKPRFAISSLAKDEAKGQHCVQRTLLCAQHLARYFTYPSC
jgi:hypothetical protein